MDKIVNDIVLLTGSVSISGQSPVYALIVLFPNGGITVVDTIECK